MELPSGVIAISESIIKSAWCYTSLILSNLSTHHSCLL